MARVPLRITVISCPPGATSPPRILHADATSEERVAALRDHLINESHVMVNAVLLSALGREAHVSPVAVDAALKAVADQTTGVEPSAAAVTCLLYTSDAADDLLCVDL